MTLPLTLEPGTALWVDAAGTLLHPARPIAQVYAAHARAGGHRVNEAEIAGRLRPAMARHRALRHRDPAWTRFWQAVVADVIDVVDAGVFESLYEHYAKGEAWRIADGGRACLARLRERGVRCALISNWDVRLRQTLDELDLLGAFDAVVISGEVGIEKPDPGIFARAARRLNVPAERSLMVGDDRETDLSGARQAGAFVMQFGNDINSFDDIMAS